MSELDRHLKQPQAELSPHIEYMRLRVLGDLAVKQAMRQGYSNTGTEEIRVEPLIKPYNIGGGGDE